MARHTRAAVVTPGRRAVAADEHVDGFCRAVDSRAHMPTTISSSRPTTASRGFFSRTIGRHRLAAQRYGPGAVEGAAAHRARWTALRLRVVRVIAAAAAVVLVLVLSWDGARPPTPLPAMDAPQVQVQCTESADRAEDVARLLANADAGMTMCVTGDSLRDADLVLQASGSAERPISIVANDTVVHSVTVTADHVVVQGFIVEGGDGIVLEGTGLVARHNVVRDATDDGISCSRPCSDAEIAHNTVVRADGSGIDVEGQRILVRANSISDSRQIESGDADGIRFFGNDIVIEDNRITDITDAGYGEDAPHTDCFQTFDNSGQPTVGVTITRNTCRNVDHQCLIVTAEQAGNEEVIGRSRNITFSYNICEVNGSQAVLVQWVPNVRVVSNILTGPNLDRAVIFLDGSIDAEFLDNTVPMGVLPYEIDDASLPGLDADWHD